MGTNGSNKKSDAVKRAESSFKENASSALLVGGSTSSGEKKIEKKFWNIKSAKNGYVLEFFPIFVINEETKEPECRNLEMKFTDDKGRTHEMLFDWMNIYMFCYFTANEELRQQLATRYERKVNFIPYDVKIPVTAADFKAGSLTRRVELPVDELTMAVAREEAWKILLKNKDHWNDPQYFRYKKK